MYADTLASYLDEAPVPEMRFEPEKDLIITEAAGKPLYQVRASPEAPNSLEEPLGFKMLTGDFDLNRNIYFHGERGFQAVDFDSAYLTPEERINDYKRDLEALKRRTVLDLPEMDEIIEQASLYACELEQSREELVRELNQDFQLSNPDVGYRFTQNRGEVLFEENLELALEQLESELLKS